MKKKQTFFFNVKPCEQLDACINLEKDERGVIAGVVRDCHKKPVKDAVVKLYEVKGCGCNELEPITHAFTDECGSFLFGPLCPCMEYAVKVWVNNIRHSHKCVELEAGGKCLRAEKPFCEEKCCEEKCCAEKCCDEKCCDEKCCDEKRDFKEHDYGC